MDLLKGRDFQNSRGASAAPGALRVFLYAKMKWTEVVVHPIGVS